MKKSTSGFSLIELLVVIAIIGILSSVLYFNIKEGTAQSRDAERKSDLRNIQAALELYKNDVGRYPPGCNAVGFWSGEIGTSYACPTGPNSQYIVKLAPKYLPTLPTDPKRNASESNGSGFTAADSGYMYRTNTNGTVYKLVARNTVETETLNYESEFKACDVVQVQPGNAQYQNAVGGACPSSAQPFVTSIPEGTRCGYAICNVYSISLNGSGGYQYPATDCSLTNIGKSYAVYGGYAAPSEATGAGGDDLRIERATESVVCDMP